MTDRLLATCWTSAGNVRPGITSDTSPHSIEERIRAVAETGYTGIGIEYADLAVARETIGLRAVRDLISDAGLASTEIEFLDDWFLTGDRRSVSDQRRRDLLDMAEVLGAHHVKVGAGRVGDNVSPDRLREEFARLGEEAVAHGTRVAMEPGAFSMLADLDEAIDLILDVGDPNAGLIIDIWHLARTGYPYTRVSSRVPSWALLGVEINDGAAHHGRDLLADAFDNRLLAGSGDFRVPEFVEAVRNIGFEGPWGVENMSIQHRKLDIHTALTQAGEAVRSVLQPTGSKTSE